MYVLEPIRGCDQGSRTTITSMLSAASATLGFGFLLRSYLSSNSVNVLQFVRPYLVINVVLIAFFLFLLVFLIMLVGISLLVRSIVCHE
jgi:hypothetical protein